MKLCFVPTPIGNLQDITLRAIQTLQEADLIVAEDTRHSGLLMQHLKIPDKKFVSLHSHNEHFKTSQLIERIQKEQLSVAVVSDAGTPGISDPGFLLSRKAIEAGIPVECLPGPTEYQLQ